MNETDAAAALLREYGDSRAADYAESWADRLGLNAERIVLLIELAQVKVTWDE